jgi:hypothetical protein
MIETPKKPKMMKNFKKTFKNYECELQGVMINIRENGTLVRAIEVNPLFAMERFNEVCGRVQKMVMA